MIYDSMLFLFTVVFQFPWGTTDSVLIDSRATHRHALSRPGPSSPGRTGLQEVDNACSALWRRKEHTAGTAPTAQSAGRIDRRQGQHPPLGCWRYALGGGPGMDRGNRKSKRMFKKKKAARNQNLLL